MHPERPLVGVAGPGHFVSRRWKSDIVGAPAMVMAFGVLLQYPGRFLLERHLDQARASGVYQSIALAIFVVAAFMVVRMVQQAFLDRTVLFDLTSGHFRIGTWVAATNVVASLMSSVAADLAMVLQALAIPLFTVYLAWLVGMAVRRKLDPGTLTGTVFLTTVATQSMVIGFMAVYPGLITESIAALIVLNVLGIVFYWISFTLTWVVGGFVDPLRAWTPQNNITHGALSITMLAAQMIEVSMPGTLPYFHLVIQIVWVASGVLLICSFTYEVVLAFGPRRDLREFRLGNYARNFTYAMFFAATYYGYVYERPSAMKSLFTPDALEVLAIVVCIMTAWELFNQIAGSVLPSRTIAATFQGQ